MVRLVSIKDAFRSVLAGAEKGLFIGACRIHRVVHVPPQVRQPWKRAAKGSDRTSPLNSLTLTRAARVTEGQGFLTTGQDE